MRVRDELGELFTDDQFAAAFATRGQPGLSPGQLALVTVLQFASNLTDRQAAEAVRGRIDWKYCLGLELDDPGFDFSVLSEFRSRLVEHGLAELVLDVLLARLGELGLVKAGGKQRTDSTHVISAIRDLDRVELAGEAVRACLEALAAAAPQWLAAIIDLPVWSSVAVVAAVTSLAMATSPASADTDSQWTAAWTASMIAASPPLFGQGPDNWSLDGFANHSVRQVVRVTRGGGLPCESGCPTRTALRPWRSPERPSVSQATVRWCSRELCIP
jgi:transposase